MTNKDIYKIWAPLNEKWVDWVRPVPFISLNNNMKNFKPSKIVLPVLSDLNKEKNTTAIIVDLHGAQSVEVGILLAQIGYRPIPIYNGVQKQNNSRETTDNQSILSALVWGSTVLSNINIASDAPPAFLTDKNRLQRYKIDCSVFDNSWDVYHQDLPSEDYFLNNGITKIIVISDSLSKDLKEIFSEYSKKKLQIFLTNGYEPPICIRYSNKKFGRKRGL